LLAADIISRRKLALQLRTRPVHSPANAVRRRVILGGTFFEQSQAVVRARAVAVCS